MRNELQDQSIEMLGWALAECCAALDRGEDPRQMEVPAVLERARQDFFRDKSDEYDPDYVSHPCDTLDEIEGVDETYKKMVRVSIDVLEGQLDIIIKMLCTVTKSSRSFWLNRIINYYSKQCKEIPDEK